MKGDGFRKKALYPKRFLDDVLVEEKIKELKRTKE